MRRICKCVARALSRARARADVSHRDEVRKITGEKKFSRDALASSVERSMNFVNSQVY